MAEGNGIDRNFYLGSHPPIEFPNYGLQPPLPPDINGYQQFLARRDSTYGKMVSDLSAALRDPTHLPVIRSEWYIENQLRENFKMLREFALEENALDTGMFIARAYILRTETSLGSYATTRIRVGSLLAQEIHGDAGVRYMGERFTLYSKTAWYVITNPDYHTNEFGQRIDEKKDIRRRAQVPLDPTLAIIQAEWNRRC